MSKVYAPLPPTTFLDLDGVCVAWIEAVYALYDEPVPPGPMSYEQAGEPGGRSADEVWDRINALGSDWWRDLPVYPWFPALLKGLRGLGPQVVVLTSPCTEGHSAKGKVQWMRRHIGGDFRNYVITSQKHLLAHPRAVLVDDSDEKLEKFAAHGGSPVVFPRQWNSGGYLDENVIADTVVSRVREAFLRAGVRA